MLSKGLQTPNIPEILLNAKNTSVYQNTFDTKKMAPNAKQPLPRETERLLSTDSTVCEDGEHGVLWYFPVMAEGSGWEEPAPGTGLS